MTLDSQSIHPKGECDLTPFQQDNVGNTVDTFDGKIHIEWDNEVSVTPIGQLSFFIEYLKVGDRFMPWIEDCPLTYLSNNAPTKREVLGSLLLSILSGHRRYAHMQALVGDGVNGTLLGMKKIVSDDSARRGIKKVNEQAGLAWINQHLYRCYEPLLTTAWILDVDVTIKSLYGHQEEAVVGYHPKKPGRPSHTYHTYMIANIRIVLGVEVLAGNQSSSSYSLPGLIDLIDSLPVASRPYCTRGDCDFGNEVVMCDFEAKGYHYLFKLRKSKYVQKLIEQQHGQDEWKSFNAQFEAKEARLKLASWTKERRVVIVRKRLSPKEIMGVDYPSTQPGEQLSLALVADDMKLYEYAVLVTDLSDDLITLIQHYRDRADCENVFDEMKNQWGWSGFTSQDIKSCRLMAGMIALIYNWWTLFVRLSHPNTHIEAITSRPLLLSSVGRLIKSGRQRRLILTSQHAKHKTVKVLCQAISSFLATLKSTAPQLSGQQRWQRILASAMRAFPVDINIHPPNALLAAS